MPHGDIETVHYDGSVEERSSYGDDPAGSAD